MTLSGLGVAEASDGIGGLGPELCISCGSAGLAAREQDCASCYGPDRKYHLPFHAVHHSGLIGSGRYGVGLWGDSLEHSSLCWLS